MNIKRILARALLALTVITIGLFLTGCITTPTGKQVSPLVVAATESVVCAGAIADAQVRPQDRPILHTVYLALTDILSRTNGVQVGSIDAVVGSIPGALDSPWIAPALVLIDQWAAYGLAQDDSTSARLLVGALRNGLACGASATALASSTSTTKLGQRAEVFRWRDGSWSWRLVSIGNGKIVSQWGESSPYKANAVRSAKQRNPTATVLIFNYPDKFNL